jgi:hypothetical protein
MNILWTMPNEGIYTNKKYEVKDSPEEKTQKEWIGPEAVGCDIFDLCIKE